MTMVTLNKWSFRIYLLCIVVMIEGEFKFVRSNHAFTVTTRHYILTHSIIYGPAGRF